MREAAPPPARPLGTPTPPSQAEPASLMVRSEELLRGGRELTILHGEACYRLRLTQQDKLILTK